MKKNNIPKHRKLMIEALNLLLTGKNKQSKNVIKKAKAEINKFYTK